jgi:hypothetical protein
MHLKKNVRKNRRGDPGTLATLDIQDTGRRQTKQKQKT